MHEKMVSLSKEHATQSWRIQAGIYKASSGSVTWRVEPLAMESSFNESLEGRRKLVGGPKGQLDFVCMSSRGMITDIEILES